jgi:hypothetical protein
MCWGRQSIKWWCYWIVESSILWSQLAFNMLKLNLWSCHGSLEVDVLEKRVQKLEEEIIRNQVKISNAVEALKDILDKLSLN